MNPSIQLRETVAARADRDGIALIPFITAGYPTLTDLPRLLDEMAPRAAAIEIGVPFSDPMADGITIQRSSHGALARGATLCKILDGLERWSMPRRQSSSGVPLVLMGYLNPLLSFGLAALAERCVRSGVTALIVPDLPLEESDLLTSYLRPLGIGLIQLISPLTSEARAARIASATDGLLYAVSMTGTTGSAAQLPGQDTIAYLARLRRLARTPVCVGFGIRSREDVSLLRGSCEGAIVGSALIEAIEHGEHAGDFLTDLLANPATSTR